MTAAKWLLYLSNYTTDLQSDPARFASSAYPNEYNFKYHNEGELYQVNGQWLQANQFGNFAAGYAGMSAFGDAGWAAMRAGGIWFAAMTRNAQGARTADESWTDLQSAPMINAGARRAHADATSRGSVSMRGSVMRPKPQPPLTSRSGCDNK
jgi:hypothetical protein